MYRRQFTQTIMPSIHNLKSGIFDTYYLCKYKQMLQRQAIYLENIKEASRKLQIYLKHDLIFKMNQIQKSRTNAKPAPNVLRVWAHQCECVVVQRLRRFQQMFCMYSNLWEEHAFRELLRKMRQNLTKRSKNVLLGAIGISGYNWESNRISEQQMRTHLHELDYVYELKENTICLACDHNQKSQSQQSSLCKCGTVSASTRSSGPVKVFDNWVPFIEKRDLVVWRRLHASGHYEYKVYGSYNDVTANDFLNVQIDVDYRRKWDTTAVVLQVAESDPAPTSNSDIIYWEMLWPRLFVNRDYVFNRRYLIDKDTKTIIIYSKSTDHPAYPKFPDKFRIEDYYSCMVIKPYTEMHKPGVEFSLTYFDNPGVNIPQSVTTWVAMRAMPDFLERLREAAKKYADEGGGGVVQRKPGCRQEKSTCWTRQLNTSENRKS